VDGLDSATAGEVDHFGGTAPKGVDLDKPREVRRGSYAVIFQALSQTLESHRDKLLTSTAHELQLRLGEFLESALPHEEG
jgi:hypothetical protein